MCLKKEEREKFYVFFCGCSVLQAGPCPLREVGCKTFIANKIVRAGMNESTRTPHPQINYIDKSHE